MGEVRLTTTCYIILRQFELAIGMILKYKVDKPETALLYNKFYILYSREIRVILNTLVDGERLTHEEGKGKIKTFIALMRSITKLGAKLEEEMIKTW